MKTMLYHRTKQHKKHSSFWFAKRTLCLKIIFG